MTSKEIGLRILRIVMIIGIVAIVGMMLISAGYTYMVEDDFSFEGASLDLVEKYGSHLKGAIMGGIRLAKESQGTYLFNFLIHYVNAYNRGGLPGMHVVMITVVLGFFGAFFYMLKGIIKNKTYLCFFMLLGSVAICCVTGSAADRDYFFWYTGAMNYTVEMALSFLSTGMVIRLLKREKTKWPQVIACSIISFLASGGALCVSAANCAWILIVYGLNLKNLKDDKKMITPFITAFLGALGSTLNPGNFPKTYANQSEGHVTLGDAIRDTFVCFGNEHKSLFGSPVFLLVLFLTFASVFLLGKFIDRKVSLGMLLFATGSTLVTQILVMFPVLLAYHKDYLSSPRTQATYEIVAKLMYIFVAVMLALWLRGLEIKMKLIPVGAALIVALGLFVVSDHKTGDYDCYFGQVFRDFTSGALLGNYHNREYELACLEMADPGSDLVLFMKNNVPVESAYGMGIGDSPDLFCNTCAAGMFRLNSVAVIWIE